MGHPLSKIHESVPLVALDGSTYLDRFALYDDYLFSKESGWLSQSRILKYQWDFLASYIFFQ